MSVNYSPLNKHIELFTEKGYLAENFKTASQVGYWLRDLNRQYEQCRTEALINNIPGKFLMTISGTFNGGLQKMQFDFRFKYDPGSDDLSLASLHAKLGTVRIINGQPKLSYVRKTYYLSPGIELPSPAAVFEVLSRPAVLAEDVPTFLHIWNQQQRDRDSTNDYQENDEDYRPHHSDLKDQKPEHRPPKVGQPPKLKR